MELRAIQINDALAGSLDWELPSKLANDLSAAHPDAQIEIEKFLKRELTEYLYILMTTVISNNPAISREILMRNREKLTTIIAASSGRI